MVLDFDDDEVLDFARLNPRAVTDRELPVFVDEYQREASSLQWILKARLNRGTQFGMFALAGSSSFTALPPGIQTLTGRLQRLAVMPFTQSDLCWVNWVSALITVVSTRRGVSSRPHPERVAVW